MPGLRQISEPRSSIHNLLAPRRAPLINVLATVTAAVQQWLRTPARLLWRMGRWVFGLLLLAWTLVLLILLVLHGLILPHIDEWRPALEQQASRSLGIQLRIGSIVVNTGAWIPALDLREVRLLDPQGRETLRLPGVKAALSVRSLLAFELRFSQLLIDAPQLEVRRDAQGKFFVGGLSVDAAEQAQTSGLADEVADWLFSQHELVILNGRVRWIDELRIAPPLELSDLSLVLRNGLRQHDLRLDATPPPDWGQRFSLQGKFTQKLLKRPGDLSQWTGQFYANLPHTDLGQLRRHVDLPFELSEGDGALRAWLDVKNGKPEGVTVDMGLRAVKLRLNPSAEMLDLAHIEGRLQLQRDPQRLKLQAIQLGFVSGDGVVWPRSDWDVQLRIAEPSGKELGAGVDVGLDGRQYRLLGGEFRAQRLDLALMAQIAQRLPIGAEPRAGLGKLAPQGLLTDLIAVWDGPLDAPRSYRVKARIDGLRVASLPGAGQHSLGHPGVAGVALQLDATEHGGQAQLSMADGVLDWPGLLEQRLLPLQRLAANLDWRIEPGNKQIELKVSGLQFSNADLRCEFDAVWRSGRSSPGNLDLTGRIDRIVASKVQGYLPLSLGESVHVYLKDAIRSGEVRAVAIKLRGELADFPFNAGHAGQFRITAQARDVTLAYVPPAAGQPLAWPVLEHIDAELLFDRGSMQIRNGRAKVLGYDLLAVNGGIKNLLDKPVLEIDGSGRGPAAELLRFMKASPVNEWTGAALAQSSSTGPALLSLGLQLPLADLNKTAVKGSVQLLGNDLRIRPDVPLLGNARGKVLFDRNGVTVQAGQAKLVGGDATVEGGSQRDGSLRFMAQGLATAEGLRRTPELGLAAKLAQAASGQSTYRLQLGFVQGQTEYALTSNLAGIALDLPAPLRKEAESLLPLRLQSSLQGPARDELRIDLGNALHLQYQRDLSSEPARVLRGAVSVQENLPPLPASGVQFQANLASVNLDDWSTAAQRFFGGETLDSGYAPNQIALRAQSLQLSGRPLTQVVAGITRAPEQGNWRITLDAQQLSGYLEWRAATATNAGRVYARLARLALPKQDADSVSQLLESQPVNVPALDIVIDDFELRGKHLGRLEVEAQASGAARDWRLSRLQLKNADAVLNATGNWASETGVGPRRTKLDWKLDVADAGNFLERMGQGRVLRGGRGQLNGQIGWSGSPLSPDYPSMTGKLNLLLDAGQFLKAEPGVGRLLGVLSLQSLPRRFLLDFRDVFAEGFAFDGVTGDVTVERGMASSNNLRMRGVQAAILLEGRADLAAETQNLRVLVVPEMSAGGAALAYAAINPAIGLGAFLAQLVLSRPMAAANTHEFHITGNWDDPKVERVEHRIDVPSKGASAP